MPELPEVEAVVRKLKRQAPGGHITGFQALHPRVTHPQRPSHVAQAVGHTIQRVERRGKNIVVRLDKDAALHVHLKMTGNFVVIPDHRLHTSTARAVFSLKDGRGLVLDDRRVLGHVHYYTTDELEERLKGIGVDPLSRAFTPQMLIDAAGTSSKPAKVFLMDQKPVAGLGNIYAAEALFRARIHPSTRMKALRRSKVTALHAGIQDALRSALPEAIRSYREPDVHEGMTYFVYDREGEPCLVCRRKIRRVEQAGRSTYYCPGCQKNTAL